MALSQDVILMEILLRLPFKSLLRFRSVCKSWNSLFSEPGFIKNQINRSAQNPNNYLVINPVFGDIAIVSNLSGIRLFDHVPSRNYSRSNAEARMLGSINGLVCIFLWKLEQFIIWNPVIRRGRKITPPRPLANHFWRSKVYFGICWDGVENDYQIVTCFVDHSTVSREVCLYVYSCNSKSWSLVPDISVSISRPTSKIPSAIVNGVPYWKTQHGKRKVHLIKFEVGRKEFKELPELELSAQHEFLVVNWKDCISVLVYEAGSSDCLVHVHNFDERCGIWSKMLSIGPIPSHVSSLSACFKYGGEIVLNASEIEYMLRYMCYDYKTNTKTKIISLGWWRLLEWFSYEPSLLFLKGMKPLATLCRSCDLEVMKVVNGEGSGIERRRG